MGKRNSMSEERSDSPKEEEKETATWRIGQMKKKTFLGKGKDTRPADIERRGGKG